MTRREDRRDSVELRQRELHSCGTAEPAALAGERERHLGARAQVAGRDPGAEVARHVLVLPAAHRRKIPRLARAQQLGELAFYVREDLLWRLGAVDLDDEKAALVRERGHPLGVQSVLGSPRRAWAIEGTGSYGAGLARFLAGRGEAVLEVSRTPRAERRLRGKDDALDAARTARAALASETLALPRAGERREALRLLLVARRSAVDVRREALGQLRGVIVTAPDRLREELRGLPAGSLLERCRRLRRSSSASADELATRLVLRSLARRIEAATLEAAELEREILAHVRALAPQLLDEPGVGPIAAAQLLVAWSHHGRVRSEAAFARLAGVAPVPASSGQTQRHRLSRGGDRQLNRALHTVVLHRRQHDPATKEYIARRIAEGKSSREATRLLKRYLARHLYRLLQNQEPRMA